MHFARSTKKSTRMNMYEVNPNIFAASTNQDLKQELIANHETHFSIKR